MIAKNEEQAVEQLKKAVSGMKSEEAFMSLMFAAADVLGVTAVEGAADRFWVAVRRFSSEESQEMLTCSDCGRRRTSDCGLPLDGSFVCSECL